MKIVNDGTVAFRTNISKIVYNYLFTLLLVAGVVLLSSRNLRLSLILLMVVFGLSMIHVIASKFLISMQFISAEDKINLQISGRMFSKQNLTLNVQKVFFSYKYEVTGRGTRNLVFTSYDASEMKIIKLSPPINGFKLFEINEIVSECKKMRMKELV